MFASRTLTFILFTGVVFGIVAATSCWVNGTSVWVALLAYVFGGNVGVSLGAAIVYAQNVRDTES